MRGLGYSNSRGAAQSDRDAAFRYPPGSTIHPMPVQVHGEAREKQEDKACSCQAMPAPATVDGKP